MDISYHVGDEMCINNSFDVGSEMYGNNAKPEYSNAAANNASWWCNDFPELNNVGYYMFSQVISTCNYSIHVNVR